MAQDRASLISQDNRSRKDVVLKMTRANVVQEDLFENEAEDNLYRKVLEIAAKKTSPRGLFDVLVTLVPFIDEFFANVMVMHENVLIKHNRLRLLELVNSEFLKIADFSKIRKNV